MILLDVTIFFCFVLIFAFYMSVPKPFLFRVVTIVEILTHKARFVAKIFLQNQGFGVHTI